MVSINTTYKLPKSFIIGPWLSLPLPSQSAPHKHPTHLNRIPSRCPGVQGSVSCLVALHTLSSLPGMPHTCPNLLAPAPFSAYVSNTPKVPSCASSLSPQTKQMLPLCALFQGPPHTPLNSVNIGFSFFCLYEHNLPENKAWTLCMFVFQ